MYLTYEEMEKKRKRQKLIVKFLLVGSAIAVPVAVSLMVSMF